MHKLKYDDREIRQKGIKALTKRLGFAGTVRFLRQFTKGEDDYLEIQERLFKGMNVEEIFKEGEKYFIRSKRRKVA